MSDFVSLTVALGTGAFGSYIDINANREPQLIESNISVTII